MKNRVEEYIRRRLIRTKKVKFASQVALVIRLESLELDRTGEMIALGGVRRAREDSGSGAHVVVAAARSISNRANSHGATCSGIIINLYGSSESDKDPKINKKFKEPVQEKSGWGYVLDAQDDRIVEWYVLKLQVHLEYALKAG
ncbi:uncharacterized protein PGTG_13610 [Puccinia graminis f. sp. tritici CRL 75-36-700-3]|uniref:Uncharacterized protein n=1 Tax=Puccinia graminis f. sp. tritici (strain CRL 75-36-700-3 / race SCCL) TaxID=418459 RepID=E3KSZ6_PUCGT|nr:uncharacterized protein PGTG_13610 [Puccinia graminis f. sp. tritici CRL 75-36-700-3]EFP87382.1 hypothetical protein PGTG_13610 [Puccinia graminis f. sp. tritici CRL 75-36-700-3]